MEVVECFFNDVLVIKTKIFQDKRGSFEIIIQTKMDIAFIGVVH